MLIDIGQLEFIDPKLRKLAVWVENETGWQPTITSLYRIDDEGVHGQIPLRGLDLRMRSQEIGEAIERKINNVWLYDHMRPAYRCARLHGKGANLHIHLQVHTNTVKRS